jgi:uncharacterized membrane protein YfcA
MTPAEAALGILVGLVSGILSGLFGVGGGIVMTPGLQILLGAAPIVALATPLPVILPTAAMGAYTYGRAGELDTRAATWIVGPGIAGAIVGSWLTTLIDTHLLLVVTAALLAYQALSILRGARSGARERTPRAATPGALAGIGLAAGTISGLLGIGGGLIMVPLMAGVLGMPLRRVLGTSLLAIVALVIPGTIVHTALGHIDWALFAVATIGAVPGARIGASIALGTRERTLRILVGSFLLAVSVVYGASEVAHLVRS